MQRDCSQAQTSPPPLGMPHSRRRLTLTLRAWLQIPQLGEPLTPQLSQGHLCIPRCNEGSHSPSGHSIILPVVFILAPWPDVMSPEGGVTS